MKKQQRSRIGDGVYYRRVLFPALTGHISRCESRDEIYRVRVLALIASAIMGRKLKLYAAQKKRLDEAALVSMFNESRWEILARLVRSDGISFAMSLKFASEKFTERECRLFVKAIAEPGECVDAIDRVVLLLWDGFDLLPRRPKNNLLTALRAYPPLSRWAGPAAYLCVRLLADQSGLTYSTYRQRVRRLGLGRQLPLLVTKAEIDASNVLQILGPRELLAYLEEHRQKHCDRTGGKLSHDKRSTDAQNRARRYYGRDGGKAENFRGGVSQRKLHS
jgi:hypothetical protein